MYPEGLRRDGRNGRNLHGKVDGEGRYAEEGRDEGEGRDEREERDDDEEKECDVREMMFPLSFSPQRGLQLEEWIRLRRVYEDDLAFS